MGAFFEKHLFQLMLGLGALVAAALFAYGHMAPQRMHAKARELGLQSVELSVDEMS